MIKISIIMPVYNSEAYLTGAVESILAQDFDEYELILVDDGSKDRSGSICDSFAEKSDRVAVIHKQNGGICSARNAGLDRAQGEYIGFCDNDDLYLPGLLKENYALAAEHHADLVRYNRIKRYIMADGKQYDHVIDLPDLVVEKKDFGKQFRAIRQSNVWTALYSRAVIEEFHIRFDEEMRFGNEDVNFNLLYILHSQKMVINSKPYYLWSQREARSTSRKFALQGVESILFNLSLEDEIVNGALKGTVSDYEKNRYLLNNYVYLLVEYMSIPDCRISGRKKREILERMRNAEVFDKEYPAETLRAMKQENPRMWITLKWFYERKYRRLLTIVGKGTRFLIRRRASKESKA